MSQEFSPNIVSPDAERAAQPESRPSLDARGAHTRADYPGQPFGPEMGFAGTDQRQYEESERQPRQLGKFAYALLWAEPIWIALLTPLLLLPGQFLSELFHPIIVAGLFFFWPARLLLQHRIAPRTSIDFLLALILLLVPVSLWISPDKNVSWVAAGYLLLGVAIYIAIVNWPVTVRYPWLVGVTLCALGLGLAAIGPQILARAPTKLFESPELQVAVVQARESGLETINPNILGGGLVFILPLLFALALQTNLLGGTGDELRDKITSTLFTIVCAALALAVATVLILTQSRGAYVAAALSCWLVLLLRWPRMWLLWVLLLVGGVGGVSWYGADNLLGQSKFDHSINSFEGRTEIWIRTIEGLFDYPLTGIGIGTFSESISRLYPFSLYSAQNQPHAHNMLLQVGADLGLVGLSAIVGLLIGVIMMFSQTIQAYRLSHSGLYVAFAIGGIGAICSMIVHGFFDAALWGTKLSPLPWMLYGLAVILPKQKEKKSRRRRRSRNCSG